MPLLQIQTYFYPRPPRGGRLTGWLNQNNNSGFLSTPSARRATTAFPASSLITKISIHALREEGDIVRRYDAPTRHSISIHALREEGDPSDKRRGKGVEVISIHALREEGDCCLSMTSSAGKLFLSTPSARRATPCTPSAPISRGYFYPRPPRGGRRIPLDHVHQVQGFLSTPSARRATRTIHSPRSLCTFLSTPSARRATAFQPSLAGASFYFYPRPPRGGRHRQHGRRSSGAEISIHALREEGDVIVCLLEAVVIVFLSTPSARRATISRRRR